MSWLRSPISKLPNERAARGSFSRVLVTATVAATVACVGPTAEPSRSPRDPANPGAPEAPAEASDLLARPSPAGAPGAGADAGVVYTCPMHPEVRSEAAGTCPKCGMTLVPRQR